MDAFRLMRRPHFLAKYVLHEFEGAATQLGGENLVDISIATFVRGMDEVGLPLVVMKPHVDGYALLRGDHHGKPWVAERKVYSPMTMASSSERVSIRRKRQF